MMRIRIKQLRFVVMLLAVFSMSTVLADTPFRDLVSMSGEDITNQADVGEGQWVMVMVWATDCSICKQQKPMISAFHEKFKDTKAKVYGIAIDGRDNLAQVQDYLDNNDVSFPTYVGELGLVALQFEAISGDQFRGTPTYLLFNPDGELKGVNMGPLTEGAVERFIIRNS